ncbi:MAG: amidohydrolase family protein [Candidatus Doudnabacteria bacterium]
MYSKILKNAKIIDGTGRQAYKSDLAIEQDKIVQIGNLQKANAQEIIDLEGKYLVPGFVDIQNHSDVYWTIFDNPNLDSLVAQGITTAVMGNCGASLAPLLSRDALLSIQKWHNLEGVNLNWMTFAEYLDELSHRSFGVNRASMVGYSTLRRGLVKDDIRGLTSDEQKVLKKTFEESIDAGAFGLSSGLSYAHEAIISEQELLDLAKIVKSKNALMSVHLRSEGAELTESVSEALELINKTDVNLKISHFKVRNKSNWHLLPHALNLIENNYQKKSSIHFDIYPYDFIWQVLYTYLPKWSYEGGREIMLSHLKNKDQRKKIKAYLVSQDINYSAIMIASTTMPLNVVGKTLGELASRQECDSEDALLNIIERGGSEILVFEENLNSKQIETLLGHSLSMVATDGAGFPLQRNQKTLAHPRCFGTMPKFLHLVRKESICSLEEGIKKITLTPAEKVGLKKRGSIAVDNYADLVVFDDTIDCKANFKNPYQSVEGISYVFVNGELALEHGKPLGQKHGKVLRKK